MGSSLAFVVGFDGESRKKVFGVRLRGRASGNVGLAEIGPWMGSFVNFFEGADGHVRVGGRRFKRCVPEHGLDHANVGAAFEHQRGHRVTKEMAGAALSNPRRSNVLPSEQGQVTGSDSGSLHPQVGR